MTQDDVVMFPTRAVYCVILLTQLALISPIQADSQMDAGQGHPSKPCGPDVERFCPDVPWQAPVLSACLREHALELSKGCRDVQLSMYPPSERSFYQCAPNPVNHSHYFWFPNEATNVQFLRCGRSDHVTYRLKLSYPATVLTNRILRETTAQGFQTQALKKTHWQLLGPDERQRGGYVWTLSRRNANGNWIYYTLSYWESVPRPDDLHVLVTITAVRNQPLSAESPLEEGHRMTPDQLRYEINGRQVTESEFKDRVGKLKEVPQTRTNARGTDSTGSMATVVRFEAEDDLGHRWGVQTLTTANREIHSASPRHPCTKSIKISARPPAELTVSIHFFNVSSHDVFVLKEFPSLFVTTGGEDIDYIGPSEKRKAYTLDDYERVKPVKSTERVQNVASLFAWKPGAHTYEVSISGDYTDPTDGRAWKSVRVSDKFTWTR